MDCYVWNILSTVANLLMALFALIAIWQNRKQLKELKKQYNEDSRARLQFEIVANRGPFLLKITNVGKETAYDVKLNIESELINNHFSSYIKQFYSNINEISSTIVAGRSLYYYLSPIKGSNSATIHKEEFDFSLIDKWLDQYIGCPIIIKGTYSKQYAIDEEMTINGFMAGGSITVYDESILALQEISKVLACKNDFHCPIQENIEDIMKSISQISNSSK